MIGFKSNRSFAGKVFSTVFLLGLVFWTQNAIAQGALSSMRIGQSDEKTRVVFDLTQTDKYKVYSLNNPARVVVDFYDTKNKLSFKTKHLSDSRLFKIRVAADKTRTRVVLDLHKTAAYNSFLLQSGGSNKERLVLDLLEKSPKSKSVNVQMAKRQEINSSQQKSITNKVVTSAKTPTKTVSDVASQESQAIAKQKKSNQKLAILKQQSHSEKDQSKVDKKISKDASVNTQVETVTVTNKTTPMHANAAAQKTAHQKLVKAEDIKAVHSGSILKASVKTTETVNKTKQTKTEQVKSESLLAMASKQNNSQAKPLIDGAPKKLVEKDSEVLASAPELVVAIDAGHGGKDTGAIGHNKVYEKHATLMMAKELKRIIDKQPGMRAILTREKDIFIPLHQRVKIAKKHHADIFISIHADAFHDRSVKGGSIYVLSERGASSTMAKLLARSENAALEDIRLAKLDDDVAFALSDLSREANIKASRQLAKTVLKQMRKTVKMHKSSVQSAGFAVLKSIDMPSLLIETAFISNPSEAKKLMSKSFQRKMANAIVDGLNQYALQMTPKQRWGDSLFVHYRVQRGDTLSQIAQAYQVSTLTLKKLNNIKDANALYVGKKLKIPVSAEMVAGL